MESLVIYLVSVLADAGHSGDDPVHFIVPRSRAYLADFLEKSFHGRSDVEIIVDRRHGERRMEQRPVVKELRRAERRRPKAEMIQIVIEGHGVG